jgi:hypothetical protein
MDHVGLARTVAVLDYVGGHFELEQSDMIFAPFSGPVLWIGREKIMKTGGATQPGETASTNSIFRLWGLGTSALRALDFGLGFRSLDDR